VAEVSNPVVGAEFQKELYDHLWNTVIETAVLVLKAVNQAGYLPGTLPPKGLAAQVAAGMPNMQAIIAQGGPQTNRQQKFVRDWLRARSKANVNIDTS
jgi:hypothetical protein